MMIGIPLAFVVWVGGLFTAGVAGQNGWQVIAFVLARSKADLNYGWSIVGMLGFMLLAIIIEYGASRIFDGCGMFAPSVRMAAIVHSVAATVYNLPVAIGLLTSGNIPLGLSHLLYEVFAIVFLMAVVYFMEKWISKRC